MLLFSSAQLLSLHITFFRLVEKIDDLEEELKLAIDVLDVLKDATSADLTPQFCK